MIAIPALAIATWDPHATVQAVGPATHATPVPTPDSTARDGKQRSEKTTPAALSSNLQR
jgi:hypothetical protein